LKKAKWMVLVAALVLTCFLNQAWAAGNMTGIEQKWLDFQRELKAQQVKDGKLTQDEAGRYLKDLEDKLKQSEEDVVYTRFKGMSEDNDQHFGGKFIALYAEMTNRSADEIAKKCREAKTTVFELAKQEGNLEKFQAFIVRKATDKLDGMVRDGKITKEQMENKLKHLHDLIGR